MWCRPYDYEKCPEEVLSRMTPRRRRLMGDMGEKLYGDRLFQTIRPDKSHHGWPGLQVSQCLTARKIKKPRNNPGLFLFPCDTFGMQPRLLLKHAWIDFLWSIRGTN